MYHIVVKQCFKNQLKEMQSLVKWRIILLYWYKRKYTLALKNRGGGQSFSFYFLKRFRHSSYELINSELFSITLFFKLFFQFYWTFYCLKKCCTIYAIFFVFKTLRVCNFSKREEKCMKLYRNPASVCGNKYTNFWIHSTIILEIPQIHIFPKILQIAVKIYYAHR